MERNCKLKVRIPKEIAEKYRLTEDTIFGAYFDGEYIYFKVLSKEELERAEKEELDEDESDFWYGEGREEGLFLGYKAGYRKGYSDSEKKLPFDDEYPGDEAVLGEDECADNGCEACEHFCHHCGRCNLEK